MSGFAKLTDVADVIANGAKYGIRWVTRALSKGKDKKVLLRADAPLALIADSKLVDAAFGEGTMTGFTNAQGAVVPQQNGMRPKILANPKITDRELQEYIVQSVFMNRTTRSVTTVTREVATFIDGATGERFTSQEALNEARALREIDEAAGKLAELVDAGMPYATARAMVDKWYPNLGGLSLVTSAGDDTDDDSETDES